jgi:hypothetical protein
VLRRRPVVLALCVFLLGFAFIWAGFAPHGDPFGFCPGVPQTEGTSIRAVPALWPPGTTRCEYESAAGRRSTRTYWPWDEWIALVLVAAAVGVAASAPRRPLRLGVAALLVLAAFAVFFVV